MPVRRVVSGETARRLCVLLKGVVDSGTGKKAAIPHVNVAGKTGTAQKLESGTYSKTRSWASFIGFLPADHPMLLCGVVIDEPAANLMGGTAAAPAFQKIMTQIISRPGLDYAEKILNNAPSLQHDSIAGAMALPNSKTPGIAPAAGAKDTPAPPVTADPAGAFALRGRGRDRASAEPVGRSADGLSAGLYPDMCVWKVRLFDCC